MTEEKFDCLLVAAVDEDFAVNIILYGSHEFRGSRCAWSQKTLLQSESQGQVYQAFINIQLALAEIPYPRFLGSKNIPALCETRLPVPSTSAEGITSIMPRCTFPFDEGAFCCNLKGQGLLIMERIFTYVGNGPDK